jgi:hypothetical protein
MNPDIYTEHTLKETAVSLFITAGLYAMFKKILACIIPKQKSPRHQHVPFKSKKQGFYLQAKE